MTCGDCIHCTKKRTMQSDFNVLIEWHCGLTMNNLLRKTELSETYRQKLRLQITEYVDYDNTKRKCKEHREGGTEITKYFSKEDYQKVEPTPTVKPSIPYPFLERD